jgi:hypothetical protein
MRFIRQEKPQTGERACSISRFPESRNRRYAAKSESCPLSMGSDDLFLRFEMAVMAKPMNDG